MKLAKGINPVVRAVGVFSAVAIIAGGVTYAAMSDTAALSDSTVSSANADLLVSNGGAYSQEVNGFDFNNFIPGNYTEAKNFYLNNQGQTALKVTAHVPHAPTTVDGYGFTGWENLLVKISALDPDCDNKVVNTNMQALLDGQVNMPCNPLGAGIAGSANGVDNAGDYTIAFKINSNQVTGSQVDIDDIDFQFTGTVAATPPATPPVVNPAD